MTTPTIRAALDTFQQAANRGTAVYLSPELVQELRTALKAEPEGESPRPDGDWFAPPSAPATPPAPLVVAGEVEELVAALRADAECVTAGQPDLMQLTDKQLTRIAEILKAVILGGWIVPTVEQVTPPAPETPAEALAARPLLEKVAQMGDTLLTGGELIEVWQVTKQAAAWLRSNPPGQPVKIEPRGCPTPGACSCVEPTPPAPVPGEAGEVAQWLHAHALDCRVLGRDVLGNDWAEQCTRAATLLQRLASPACLVVDRPPEGLLDLLKSEPGRIEACTAGVSIEPLGDAPRPTYLDAIRLARGCHDYSGGYTGTEGEAWHGAIDTVVGVLRRAAIGPWDSQTRAVFGVGVEAQAGEADA